MQFSACGRPILTAGPTQVQGYAKPEVRKCRASGGETSNVVFQSIKLGPRDGYVLVVRPDIKDLDHGHSIRHHKFKN